MLAALGGEHRMARVMLMWRRNIDRFYSRVGAEFLDGGIAFSGEIRGKAQPRLGARIRPGYQRDARIGGQSRQHDGERAAKAGHTQTEFTFVQVAQWPASTRTFIGLILDI